jgi:hypothetical protein
MEDRYIRNGSMTDTNPELRSDTRSVYRSHYDDYPEPRSSAREYEAAGYRPQGGARGYRGEGPGDYRGSYWHDGRRTGDQGGGRDERGFFDRAGDEVRSWFGDEEAERRREFDRRRLREQDDHYQQWRSSRISELDRDYDEYRSENARRFASEFDSWRAERQGQREGLGRVTEHMEVVGSDGEHLGTVDKVRGDRILLTRSDADSGGHHHSIPSRWIRTVDDKVTLAKTAKEARGHWREEDRAAAMNWESGEDARGPHILNRAFPGSY